LTESYAQFLDQVNGWICFNSPLLIACIVVRRCPQVAYGKGTGPPGRGT
jgi:hypothetical protein